MPDQSAPEVSEAPSTAPAEGGGGAGGEPVASGGEPTPAPSGGEPTAQAEAPTIPSPDDFGWDEWDGEGYDAFPEPVRPWAEKFGGHFGEKLTKAEQEAREYRNLYEALGRGYEDPRLAPAQEKAQALEQEKALLEKKIENLQKEYDSYLEEQDNRYVEWYQQSYGEKIPQFREMYEKPAETLMSLMEAGYEMHIATDIGLLGQKAVDDAIKMAGEVKNPEYAMELLEARHGLRRQAGPAPKTAPEPKPKPKPLESKSDSLVAGADRTVAPKRVSQEKAPPKTGNARRDRLLRIVSKHA